jgi:hypothetical protein
VAEGSKYSFKDYLFQLVTITAGVLIALGVDAVVEWRAHQSLVEEARAMIAREMEDNRKALADEQARSGEWNTDLDNSLKLANELLTKKKSDITQYGLGFVLSSLDASSWHTAERTGALNFMDYAEVKKYSEVYGLQELVVAQQRRVLDSVTTALTIGNPHDAPLKDVEAFRVNVMTIRAELYAKEQLATQLLEGYEKALKP